MLYLPPLNCQQTFTLQDFLQINQFLTPSTCVYLKPLFNPKFPFLNQNSKGEMTTLPEVFQHVLFLFS